MTRIRKTLTALLLLCAASCVKTGTINEVTEIDNVGTDPMSFTNAGIAENLTKASSSSLQSDFAVNCWKAYGNSAQWTVMDSYLVEYKVTGSAWDGNIRPYWDYTGVEGQYQKYWDYSNFPYRFHAIAPFPQQEGFNFDTNLDIPAYFAGQKCVNGTITPEHAEPYLVSQVQRNADGLDFDIFAGSTEINKGSVSKNRTVAMPFHHLNCKIRLGIFCSDIWSTSSDIYVQDLTLKVTSADFVSSAQSYHAPVSSWYIGSGNSGFSGLKKEVAGYTLLKFDGGADVDGNKIHQWQERPNAYWLQCRDGLTQIPQEGVSMSVDFKLMNPDGTLFRKFTDVPVKLADGDYVFSWKSGYQYTYYLVLGTLSDGLEIQFTASVTPWEDVSASLTTDLEQ